MYSSEFIQKMFKQYRLFCLIQLRYIKNNNYGGAMVWDLDLDDFNRICPLTEKPYPLVRLMKTILDAPSTNPPNTQPPGSTNGPTNPTNGPSSPDTQGPTDPTSQGPTNPTQGPTGPNTNRPTYPPNEGTCNNCS